MEIKICGIRREEDIEIVNKYLPNYIGFIFVKKSTDKRTFLLMLFFSSSPLALTLIAFDYVRWIALFIFNFSIIFMSLAIMNKIDIELISSNFKYFSICSYKL